MTEKDLGKLTKPYTITLPAVIDEKSKDLAAKLQVSRSQMISTLLQMILGQELEKVQGREIEKYFLRVIELRGTRSQTDEDKKFREIYESVSIPLPPSPNLNAVKKATKQRKMSEAVASLDALRSGQEGRKNSAQPA